MAEIVRYIDINSTPGGDGTTDATAGANRAYASFAEWLAAESTDLVAAGDRHTVYVAAGEYVEEIITNSAGFNTDATNYLSILAKSGDECTTLDFSNGVVISTSGPGTGTALELRNSYTRVYGLGLKNTKDSSSSRGLGNYGADCLIERVIAQGGSNTDSDGVFHALDATSTYINVISINSGRDGFYAGNFDAPKYFSCMAINNGSNGFERVGTGGTRAVARNCIAFGNGAAGFTGHFSSVNSSNNAADDGTAPGVDIASNALTSAAFTDSANGDYSIAGTGSVLYQAGADLSAEGFTDSINGVTRVAPWDVGPYALAAGPEAVNFSGPVPDQVATVGVPFSLDLSSYFSGTETPFTGSLQAGTLPATFSLTGFVISGTASGTETQTGIVIRATDQNSDTADTNAFEIDVQAAPSPPAGTTTINTVTPTVDGGSIAYTYDAADATGFELQLDAGPWVDVGTDNPVVITGLNSADSYTVALRPYNADGPGPSSAPAALNTSPDLPDAAPVIDDVVPGTTDAEVTFSYPGGDSPIGFNYRYNGGTATDAGSESPFTLAGLTASTPYDLEMQAVSEDGPGDWSTIYEFTTAAQPAAPAGVPSIDSVTAAPTQLTVYYTYTEEDADEILYQLNGGTWVSVGMDNPFVITGLTESTPYNIALAASNSVDQGTASTPEPHSTTSATVTLVSDVLVTNVVVGGSPVVLANTALDYVALYDETTKELVYLETNVTTDANGRFTITAAIPAGDYRLDWKVTGGAARMPTGTAA